MITLVRGSCSAFLKGFLVILCVVGVTGGIAWSADAPVAAGNETAPDSFKYYGPGNLKNLWQLPSWQPHRLGRDTWIFWTWGNQKFLRFGQVALGNQPLPISLDLFRLLDSRDRMTRFQRLGLINEPNCRMAKTKDKYGLWLDEWMGDPEHYYPGDPAYDQLQHYPKVDPETNALSDSGEVVDTRNYGRPSGIIGLRLFDNPKFDVGKWDVNEYFKAPGKVEPPYLVGFTCALCHIAFDPTKPPKNSEQPRWENLAANIGNQYFREGELIFTNGRVLFGDQHKLPDYATDPYRTTGIGTDDFLHHYATTQQPGTSETSRISYDFINNPNTMNAIFNLGHRRVFPETNPQGVRVDTMHILKDGGDSVGVDWALMRVPINIGCEGVYWADSLFNPFTGEHQHPFRIAEALWKIPDADKKSLHKTYGIDFSEVQPERIESLKRKYKEFDAYGQEFGSDWAEAWKRNESLKTYLVSYKPFHLKDAPEGEMYLSQDQAQVQHGQELFADHCARCHSNNQPKSTLTPDELKKFYRDVVASEKFLTEDTMTDDVRHSARELGTNMARAIATNAIDGDIWAELSSFDYKNLPNIDKYPIEFKVPVFPGTPPISVSFRTPGGGRGYYRTPSLVSLWTSAPFFHNNGLGDYSGDPSVAGRMKDFDDAVRKLLWPEKRPNLVKRTTADSTLLPGLSQAFPKLLSDRLTAEIRKYLAEKLPRNLVDAVTRDLQPKLEKLIGELAFASGEFKMEVLRDRLPNLLESEITRLGGRVEIPEAYVAILRNTLSARLQTDLAALQSSLKMNVFTIPKGTPVNLYLNLSISSLPSVILAHLRFPGGSRELAAELLRLSECPDLVEDRGHLYGTELSDTEKKDLIEFLKRL